MTKALHFNTFGGNPMATTVASAVMDVSGAVCVLCVCCVCAVCVLCVCLRGLACPLIFPCVPDCQVIEEEGLQANAKRVGDIFLKGMMELRDEFEIVGDVRGKGLMLGMELVEDKVRADRPHPQGSHAY